MTARVAGLRLVVDAGSELTNKVKPRLVSLSLSEKREAEADELDLVLSNSDGLLAVPSTGVILSLWLGWERGGDVPIGLVNKGKFVVDEVSERGPPDKVQIRARSADLTGLLRQRRTKSWAETTLGSVLNEIATRHGRTANVNADLASRVISTIEQEGKSDLAFIRDLGRRYDAIATWKNDTLVFSPIGQSAAASGAALDRVTIEKVGKGAWSFTQADRDKYDGAEAQWHDQAGARRRTISLGGSNRRKLKRIYASQEEARQAAQSAMERGAREPAKFTLDNPIPDPRMQPDMRASLSGWSDRVAAIDWLVKGVSTRLSKSSGLTQSIELQGG